MRVDLPTTGSSLYTTISFLQAGRLLTQIDSPSPCPDGHKNYHKRNQDHPRLPGVGNHARLSVETAKRATRGRPLIGIVVPASRFELLTPRV